MSKVIVRIEFTSLDGEIQWRPVYDDASVGLYANTGVQTNVSLLRFSNLRKKLEVEHLGKVVEV